MKTILVAGGCGFIGSNLCHRLVAEGNNVICIDNLFTGFEKNIQNLFGSSRFKFIKHDIIDVINIDDNIDEIYHLACPASPPKYQIDPIYTLKINFTGTMNLLELAKKKKSKILLSSTSEIYGDPKISPQNENYWGNVNMIGVRSCYDEGKRIAETLFIEYHNTYKIDIRIARIFNTYGPLMSKSDGRVVTNFITQMLNNDNISIYGDGSQTRSFCYIDDMINGLTKLMSSNYNLPVNLGNPNEINMKTLVDILYGLIDTKSKITYHPLPKDDPTNRNPDISLAMKILDWHPLVDIDQGLKKTIKFLYSNR